MAFANKLGNCIDENLIKEYKKIKKYFNMKK